MRISNTFQLLCLIVWLMSTLPNVRAEEPVAQDENVRTKNDRPNVVFFYIDDLGWTDLSLMYERLGHDQEFYETPSIDRLAAESVLFTNAYSNGPNCAPSRASLMTGCYTPRHGIFTVGDPRRGNHQHRRLEPIENKTTLDEGFVTIAETLQAAGYETAAMGKWHLGNDPTTHGFDVNVAGKNWGSPSGGGYHSPLNYPNLVVEEPNVYLTDVLTDRAVEFITTNQRKPFFLYLAHYAVHTPIQSKPLLEQKYRDKPTSTSHSNAAYAGMLQSVDESVARVILTLDDLKLSDNTIVFFYSDNGGFGGATNNHPLRGAKGMLYEGGIRVPLFIKWPGVTKDGTECDDVVTGTDVYPTLLEMTGTERPANAELDGLSLAPLLRDGDAKLDRKSVYWHFPAYLEGSGDPMGGPFRTTPAGAIRSGDWKLIEWFESGRLELYNLKRDVGELQNVATQHPAKLKELHDDLKSWRANVNAPIPTQPNPRYRKTE